MHDPRPEPRVPTRTRPRTLSAHLRHSTIIGLIVVLWFAPIALAAAWVHSHAAFSRPPVSSSPAASTPSIAAEIAAQSEITAARYDFTAPDSAKASAPIFGAFASYYAAQDGGALLGIPLTPAYPIAGGWVQFFISGALVLPASPASTGSGALSFGDPSQAAFAAAVRDPATGIIRLPLTLPLLRAGSLVSVAGAGTSSYAELRQEVTPISFAPSQSMHAITASAGNPAFTYQQAGQSHTAPIIPQPIWQFMNRPDVSPDGWQTDIGLPLTLPVSMTISEQDGIHQLQVECFLHAALIEDDSVQDAAGAPMVSALPSGLAYLQTLGAPSANTAATRQAWVTGDAMVLDAPGSGQPRAELGLNFPVTLTSDTRWIGDDLWYSVSWNNRHIQGGGWLNSNSLSFSHPTAGAPVWSSFDTLSPDLASYLHGLGGNSGAVVYDESRNHYYTYNPNREFTVASSMKVPFLLAFLSMTEGQGREPNDDEMYLLQTMIENSDNDSAQALFLEMSGMGPTQALLGQLHISGFDPNYDEWGWSTIAPLTMVQLLTALHDGRVLTAQDRALALSLMAQIEPDQQAGVGDTAPQGASYWMKDGWVPAPNGLWAMNSSGIVTLGGETYIIAVYSQNSASLDDGQAIANHVCGAVAQLLTS